MENIENVCDNAQDIINAYHKKFMEEEIRKILLSLGENPEREGLKKTPERVRRSLEYLTRGYSQDLDKVINRFDEVSYQFYIERPEIPSIYHARILTLVVQVTECAENMSIASRSFFRNFSSVRDFSQKVYFLEHETDLSSGHLKESIFDSDMPLANKLQLSTLLDEIENIADLAEDCVDELLIFTIKRDI